MKRTSLAAIAAALLGACSPFHVDQGLVSEIENAAAQTGSQPNAVREALLPPLRAEMPKGPGTPVEPRFDLVVNAAPARQVFMSLVSGTRYSMIVNPAVSGTLSLNLKDVTVREALEAIREVYGYEFRADDWKPSGKSTVTSFELTAPAFMSNRPDCRPAYSRSIT